MIQEGIRKIHRGVVKLMSRPASFWLTIAAVYCVARIATWGYPFDSDHWIFYYIGKDWLHGGQLYVSAWDHKPPLIFLFNAFMSLIAGDNLIMHRIWLTVVSVTTIILFYVLSKRLVPRLLELARHQEVDERSGVLWTRVATIAFAFITSLSQFTSSSNNTENYGILFLLAMWVCYYKFAEKKKWGYLALSGICLSMLFFLKGTFLLFGLPIAVVLFMQYRKRAAKLLGLSMVFVAPLIIQGIYWTLYFWQQGTLNDFVVASFSFSAKYASSAWHGSVSNEPLLTAETFAVIIPSVLAFTVFMKDVKKGRKYASYVVLGLSFLTGLLVVLSVGSFYPYYLQIMMPFVVLMTTYAYAKLQQSRYIYRGLVIFTVVFAVAMLGISYKQLINNFSGATARDAKESRAVANYIDANTSPNDKIFDDGYGATLYQLADRKSGSRFVSASVLLLDYRDKYGFNLDDKFIDDMEKSKAVYVIEPAGYDVYEKNIPMMNYISSHYHLEKTFTTRDVLRRNDT